jgi:hypothetical protein
MLDLDALRREADYAYARWRACDALRPRDRTINDECVRLKINLDVAEAAMNAARRQAFEPPRDAA